jgi:hypothetical protein
MTSVSALGRFICLATLLYLSPVLAEDGPPEDDPPPLSNSVKNIKKKSASDGVCSSCSAPTDLPPPLHSEIKKVLMDVNKVSSSTSNFSSNSNSQNSPPSLKIPKNFHMNSMISTCCKTVSTKRGLVDTYYYYQNNDGKWEKYREDRTVESFDEDSDPYVTGPMYDPRTKSVGASWWFGYSDKKYYKYDSPKKLGTEDLISDAIPYKVPPRKEGETDDAYYSNRLQFELKEMKLEGDPQKITTEAGRGTTARVYYIHDPIPDNEALKKLFPDEGKLKSLYPALTLDEQRRTLWVSNNAKKVIKLKNPKPWGTTTQRAATNAKRDIAYSDLLEVMAKKFEYFPNGNSKDKGIPIVKAIKYQSDPDALGRGVMIQEAVHGESAHDISNRIRRAMIGDKAEIAYLKDVLKFDNLEDAKKRINVLENFYRVTHKDAYNFGIENRIITINGRTYSGETVNTAFDYNFGTNVIWDPKEKIFKVIDY